jgi:hypothetical protein
MNGLAGPTAVLLGTDKTKKSGGKETAVLNNGQSLKKTVILVKKLQLNVTT